MKLPIINSSDAQKGLETLKKYYAGNMIPAEKKTYLTKLRNSVGPYMGIEASDGSTHYLLDAASQIATLGHGFNPSIFFGASQFLESWMNDSTTKEFKQARSALVNFLGRKLNWPKTHITITNSGAEANEVALGYCYQKRVNIEANKVLAFEGSFHGRMMVTLAATWNKSKREPFEWKNYLAEYVKYPELDDSHINVSFPKEWRELWNEASLIDFKIPSNWSNDPYVKKEVETLMNVRQQLLSKKIFAILVEPMQCEGGDCYSSDRFHTALLIMAKTFKVPVIHDEVQTGFHLGKEFFWHRQLNMKDLNGEQLNPDYVVCAKKAQVGLVLSHHATKKIFIGEEFSVASFFRGYAHAISLDQCQSRIWELEKQVLPRIDKLIKKYPTFIRRPRINGLAFAFDVIDPSMLNKFVELRFKHGLLYYPAGNQTLRFRLNTAFGPKDLNFLFERLDAICGELFLNTESILPTHAETDNQDAFDIYDWHELLLQTKLKKALGLKIESAEIFKNINQLLSKSVEASQVELIEINSGNFLEFRENIIALQKNVYEPARQTDIEKFEHTVLDKNSLCLGLINKQKKLKGIAFAGPLSLYPLERGVRMDPHFKDSASLYMLDVTIDPSLQKTGLGRSLKYALSVMAIVKGIKRIQGRNRDRLAGAMLNINLSLGAVEQNYMREDYPDFESHRDVFYYTTQVDWKKPTIHLSRGTTIPLSLGSLDKDYLSFELPYLINKVCLSNFVSEPFLDGVKDFLTVLPSDLRHAYTTSGQSEATDKVAKSIWFKSDSAIKEKNANKMLTFKNHFFGNGSMLARSLSYEGDVYFSAKKLDHPTESNYQDVLKAVESEMKTGEYLAIWLEPVLQKTMEKVPMDFLIELRKLSTHYKVALVYNETASQFFRYSEKSFMAAGLPEITPDAGLVYMSGQSGLAFTSTQYFLEQPLMMISTWDGDEFHFLTYYQAFKAVMKDTDQYKKISRAFHAKLTESLSTYQMETIKLENGSGYFRGPLPHSMSKMFIEHCGLYLVCPSYDAMKEYLNS